MTAPRIAVLQFPGVNCETETLRAIAGAGLGAEIFRWTRPPTGLRDFQGFVLPGGFSYQDRVRAGALAAKGPLIEVLAEEAARGKPVLGICNGAQVLVEGGLVPENGRIEIALARNRMPDRTGYYARWVYLRVEASPCIFTRGLEPGTVLPLPVAHGEGRFMGPSGRIAALLRASLAPLRYAASHGAIATDFPDNPNGSEASVAAVCNARGNVLAMMPHPERALELGALPRSLASTWADAREHSVDAGDVPDGGGPGCEIFRGLGRHLQEA